MGVRDYLASATGTLRDFVSQPSMSTDDMEGLYKSFRSPDELNQAIGIARGESPGQVDPRLAGLNVGQVSQIDRYTDTRRINPAAAAVYSGVLGPAWEAYKTAAMIDPGTRAASDLLAKVPHDFGPVDLSQFSISGAGKTSAPSLANVTSSAKGAYQGAKQRIHETWESAMSHYFGSR